jgi:hypothetical protein
MGNFSVAEKFKNDCLVDLTPPLVAMTVTITSKPNWPPDAEAPSQNRGQVCQSVNGELFGSGEVQK